MERINCAIIVILCVIMCSYLSMESDVSDSRPHFYSLLHIRLTAHTLTSAPHYIHIRMLIHNDHSRSDSHSISQTHMRAAFLSHIRTLTHISSRL